MFADNVNVLKLSKLGYFWSTCMYLQGIPEYLMGTKTLSLLLKKFSSILFTIYLEIN